MEVIKRKGTLVKVENKAKVETDTENCENKSKVETNPGNPSLPRNGCLNPEGSKDFGRVSGINRKVYNYLV